MKITFLTPPLSMAGGIKVIEIYANYLFKRGHQVLVVAQPQPSVGVKKKIKNILKLNFDATKQVKTHFDQSAVSLHVIDRYRPIESSDLPDADVVIATWWETAEWLEKMPANKGKKIYFIQGHEVFDYLPVARVEATYKSSLHKIVVSKWLKEIIQNRYGNSNLALVPNAVDKNHFNFRPRLKQKIPTVGFFFASSYVKGTDVALKVILELKKAYPSLMVLAFGSEALADRALLSEVSFKVLPATEEITALYKSCDVWLATSRSEGFNLTAMEAMACGTPVVSTKTGWPMESIKPYENGVLTEVDDVQALVAGVSWVLEQSQEKWQALSKNAALATEAYSWEKSGAQFEKILKDIVDTN